MIGGRDEAKSRRSITANKPLSLELRIMITTKFGTGSLARIRLPLALVYNGAALQKLFHD